MERNFHGMSRKIPLSKRKKNPNVVIPFVIRVFFLVQKRQALRRLIYSSTMQAADTYLAGSGILWALRKLIHDTLHLKTEDLKR